MLKLIEGHYRSLERSLPGEVEKALPRGPAAIVTAGAALERRVARVLESTGRRILPGLEILPGFPQLAARLSGRPVTMETVPAADRILLAMEAMRSIPAGMPYSALAGIPHAARALADFFEEDLLDRGIDPAAYEISASITHPGPGPEDSGKGGEHAPGHETMDAVLIAFERYTRLRSPLFSSTPDQVMLSALGTSSRRYRTILFHGFLDLNPLQRRLLRSVLDSGTDVVFLCPVPAALEAWQDLGRPTRSLLDRSGGERSRPDSGQNGPRFLDFADALLTGEPAPIPYGLRLVGAPGPAGVARAVMNEIAEAGKPGIEASPTAVIGSGPAFDAVESMFRMEGIPTTRPGRIPVSRLPVSALLTGIIRLRELEFHHSILYEISGSGLLKDGISASPDEIARAVQAAGLRKGAGMLHRISGLRGRHGKAGALAGALLEAEGRIPQKAPALEMLVASCEAAGSLAAPGERSTEVLEAIPGLAAVRSRGEIGFDRFAKLIGIVLENIHVEHRGIPGSVDLLGFDEARGSSYRHVIVFGLEEGVLPGVTRTDPRLPDDLRMKLELSPSSLREKEQALLFRQALECAEERLSLVRMTEDSSGREVSWSPFIGPLVEKTDRVKKLLGSGMTVTLAADPVGIFFGGSPGGHRDVRGVSGGKLPMHRPFFAEALAAERSRLDFSAPFGSHDGVIGSRPGLADGPFSPSRLQRWVRCPFLYLAERVWKLAEPCGSAVTVSPPAEVMGSILHSALARCLSDPGKRVGEALEEAAAENDLAGILGSPALAGVFTSARRGEMEKLLRFIGDSGLSPDGEGALEAERSAPIGPAGVVLGGRIDMILRRGDERIVLDLKTGAYRSRRRVAEEIMKGDLLQIPVYAAILAAGGTPVAGAGLLFSSRPSLDGIFEGEELEGFIEASIEKTAGIVEMIGNGIFPPARAASGSGACTNCWASHLCRRSPVERIPGKLSATSALVDFESTWQAGEGSDAGRDQ